MSCIYTDQPLKLESTITVDGAAPENNITAAAYSYWIPGNNAITASGSWTATIIEAGTGEIEYDIAADTLTAGLWKTQVIATSGGLTFPACLDSFTVKVRGS